MPRGGVRDRQKSEKIEIFKTSPNVTKCHKTSQNSSNERSYGQFGMLPPPRGRFGSVQVIVVGHPRPSGAKRLTDVLLVQYVVLQY